MIKKEFLSDLYSDIETGETIRTFSYPLNTHDYLFIDLSYDFLYQNEEFTLNAFECSIK